MKFGQFASIGQSMIGTFLPLVLLSFTAMVSSCIAYGCTNRSKSGSGRSFFRFPLKKPEFLAKWVQAIHRKNWPPNNYSRICSDHFDPSCLVKNPGKIGLILTENAVPSILQAKPKKERQLPKKRKLTDSLPLSSGAKHVW